jgi:hypothetical protein
VRRRRRRRAPTCQPPARTPLPPLPLPPPLTSLVRAPLSPRSVFWLGMIIIGGIGLKFGKWQRLLYGTDYQGEH